MFQAQTPRTPLPPDLHLPSRLRHILRFPAPVRASPSGHGLRPRWARCPLRGVDSDLPGPPPRTVSSRGEDAALCSALPAGSRASCSFPTETLGWGTALQPPPAPPRGPAGFGVCHVVSISVSPRLSGQNTCLCLRVPVYSAPGWGGTSMGPSVLLSSAAGRCSWGRPPEPALGEGANFSLRSKMSTRWSWSFGGEFLQRDMVRSEQPQPGGVFSERGPDLASPLAGKRAFVTEPRDAHYRGSENTEIHKE